MRKLKQRRNQLQDELYYLHFSEPSAEIYTQRRSEIEYELACIEEQIEDEKKFEPMRIGLILFAAIAAIIAIYAMILI